MSCCEVSGSTLLLILNFIYRTFRHNICVYFTILAKPLTILKFQAKLFAQSEYLVLVVY